MMRVILLCCVAAASAAVTEPRVLLKLSPLIGGPKLLRIHSQLFVDSGAGINGWDFVPKDATAPATLARLVTLRAAGTHGVSWHAGAGMRRRRGRGVFKRYRCRPAARPAAGTRRTGATRRRRGRGLARTGAVPCERSSARC